MDQDERPPWTYFEGFWLSLELELFLLLFLLFVFLLVLLFFLFLLFLLFFLFQLSCPVELRVSNSVSKIPSVNWFARVVSAA